MYTVQLQRFLVCGFGFGLGGFFFFSVYVTSPLLFLFILSYKHGDIQSTPFEKKVVWMFVRDLLLT